MRRDRRKRIPAASSTARSTATGPTTSRCWIRAWGEGGGAEPYDPAQVNSASYDVRVSDHWICPTRDPEEFRAPHVKLFPGEVVLASTLEYVRIPRTVACDLKLKSTLGRLWINHSLAGWCDPGFEGNITHAARHADIGRRHFRTLLRKHGLVE